MRYPRSYLKISLFSLFLLIPLISAATETPLPSAPKTYPHRIIVEGFNNTLLGYNWHGNSIDGSLAGMITAVDNSYTTTQAAGSLGYFWKIDPTVDVTTSLDLLMRYSAITSNSTHNFSIVAIPACTIKAERLFDRFLVGGAVGLNLWEFNKNSFGEGSSVWSRQHRFDLSARFILGVGIF